MALSVAVVLSETFNVENYRDLEIPVMVNQVVPFAHDFLYTFHSNHEPFVPFPRFKSKIAKFSHPLVFCTPAEGVLLVIGYRCRGVKN